MDVIIHNLSRYPQQRRMRDNASGWRQEHSASETDTDTDADSDSDSDSDDSLRRFSPGKAASASRR